MQRIYLGMFWHGVINLNALTYLTEIMSMTSSGVLSVTLRSRPSCNWMLPSRLVELLSSETQSTAAWPRAPSTPILADSPTWALRTKTPVTLYWAKSVTKCQSCGPCYMWEYGSTWVWCIQSGRSEKYPCSWCCPLDVATGGRSC